MHFTKTITASLLALAATVTATPVASGTSLSVVPAADAFDGFHQVDVVPSSGGVVTTYESTNGPAPPAKPQRGSNSVRCDGDNVPSQAPCNGLINYLWANANSRFASSVRAVCYALGGNFQCCASWNADVPGGVLYGNLVPAASAARDQCVNYGQSGYALDVNLQDTCLKQCLSNRPTYC